MHVFECQCKRALSVMHFSMFLKFPTCLGSYVTERTMHLGEGELHYELLKICPSLFQKDENGLKNQITFFFLLFPFVPWQGAGLGGGNSTEGESRSLGVIFKLILKVLIITDFKSGAVTIYPVTPTTYCQMAFCSFWDFVAALTCYAATIL